MKKKIIFLCCSNCRNGTLEHITFGACETKPTPTPGPTLPPVTTPTPLPSVCQVTGWTQWMSASAPTLANSGDVETLMGLRQLYSFCPEENLESIQCRVVGEETFSMESGMTFVQMFNVT